jgi:hypothetical protein
MSCQSLIRVVWATVGTCQVGALDAKRKALWRGGEAQISGITTNEIYLSGELNAGGLLAAPAAIVHDIEGDLVALAELHTVGSEET